MVCASALKLVLFVCWSPRHGDLSILNMLSFSTQLGLRHFYDAFSWRAEVSIRPADWQPFICRKKTWFAAMKHIIGWVETDALVVARCVWHQYLVGKRCIFFCDNYMVQWMLSSKALRAMLISESFYFASRSLSAMGLIGPGSHVFPLRAIVPTTRLELGMCWASFYKVQLGIDVFVPSLVWRLQISWAQRDLVSGVARCVSPHCLSKKK